MAKIRVRIRVVQPYSTVAELERHMENRMESARGSTYEEATATPSRTLEDLNDDYADDPASASDDSAEDGGGDVVQLRRHRAGPRKR